MDQIVIDSEDKFRALVEATPDCVKLFDLSGNLSYINPGGLEEHNLKNLEEALTKGWQAIETVIPEDREKFAQALKDAALGKTTRIEIHHTQEGSNREACSEIIAPVKDAQGAVIAVFGISRDITALRRASDAALDRKVRELERMNELMVGRELKMLELKKENARLKGEITN